MQCADVCRAASAELEVAARPRAPPPPPTTTPGLSAMWRRLAVEVCSLRRGDCDSIETGDSFRSFIKSDCSSSADISHDLRNQLERIGG